MTLWHTDSFGTKQVIAIDIGSPQEALAHIMNNSKTRFTIPNGKIKIHDCGAGRYSFRMEDDKCSGYVLEP